MTVDRMLLSAIGVCLILLALLGFWVYGPLHAVMMPLAALVGTAIGIGLARCCSGIVDW